MLGTVADVLERRASVAPRSFREAPGSDAPRHLPDEHASLMANLGASVAEVPKTSSEKIQRERFRAMLLDGSLEVLGSYSSRPEGAR